MGGGGGAASRAPPCVRACISSSQVTPLFTSRHTIRIRPVVPFNINTGHHNFYQQLNCNAKNCL